MAQIVLHLFDGIDISYWLYGIHSFSRRRRPSQLAVRVMRFPPFDLK
jgi:hypothetical protein